MEIAMDALVKRINRRLAHDEEQLRVTRGERDRVELGDYFIVNTRSNFITAKHVGAVGLAMQLGVLRPGEKVA